MNTVRSFAISLFITCASMSAFGAPPKVIRSVPDNGQTDIDPNLNQIVVEFDQDMNKGGFSWVGGGPKYPKTTGTPRWMSARICALPVQLEPEHEYWFSINSDKFKNFKSATGEPALPYAVSFKTRAAGLVSAPAIAPEQARESFDQLKKAVNEQYSYRDLRNVNWDKQFTEFEPVLVKANTPDAFAREAAKLLAPANDPHIWLVVNGVTIGTMTRSAPLNFNWNTASKTVPNWNKRNDVVATGRWDDGIAYILISTWEAKNSQQLTELPSLLEEFGQTKGLIVDVRPNSGGDERLTEKFAACFMDKEHVYAKHVTRNATLPGGFSPPFERKLGPSPIGPKYRGKVAVLMGKQNMSSCETFLLMMRQTPNCKLIGERSYGSSGNPQPVNLRNGVTVYLPSWKAMTADGETFEGKGIAPDIEVIAKPEQFEKSDPVLDAALKWVRQ